VTVLPLTAAAWGPDTNVIAMFAPVPKFLIIAATAVLVLVPVSEADPPNLDGKNVSSQVTAIGGI
jgi:hypothetical protein